MNHDIAVASCLWKIMNAIIMTSSQHLLWSKLSTLTNYIVYMYMYFKHKFFVFFATVWFYKDDLSQSGTSTVNINLYKATSKPSTISCKKGWYGCIQRFTCINCWWDSRNLNIYTLWMEKCAITQNVEIPFFKLFSKYRL